MKNKKPAWGCGVTTQCLCAFADLITYEIIKSYDGGRRRRASKLSKEWRSEAIDRIAKEITGTKKAARVLVEAIAKRQVIYNRKPS